MAKLRRGPAAALCAIAIAAAACTGGGPSPGLSPSPAGTATGKANPPNIVLVLTDDQRWDTLDVMPTVERELAGKGVTFANAFVVNPLCCPSRTSILTGEYSHSTGVYTNTKHHGGFQGFDDSSTIATWLQARGYRTALIGKYLNGYEPELASHVPPGWSRWFAVAHETGTPTSDPAHGGYYDYPVSDDGHLRMYGQAPKDYVTDVLAGQAVRFIKEAPAGQPLFLYFAPHAPHLPATPAPQDVNAFANRKLPRAPSYDERDVSDKPAWVRQKARLDQARDEEIDGFRRDMLRSLRDVDRAVAGMLSALDDAGRLQNTLFVFTSDNGWLGGEHRLIGKNAPYEESIRVPLVVRYDAALTGPRTDTHLVTNIDFAPTFAELGGAPAPGVEGRSLVPLLRSPSAPWRSDFLIEHLQDGKKDTPTFCQVRSTRYSYVLYKTGEQELYDLPADPYELKNRAEDPALASTVTAMRARVGELCDPPPPGFTLP